MDKDLAKLWDTPIFNDVQLQALMRATVLGVQEMRRANDINEKSLQIISEDDPK